MRLLTLVLVPAALLAGQSRFARLGEFQGPVEVQLTAADPWIPAERNLPLVELAWVRTGAGGRVEIEMDDGSMWRLGPNSLGEISDYTRLSTGQRITLLSLDHGTAYYTGQPASKDVTMLVMPGAQMTVLQGSRVRQTAQPGVSLAAILEGQVRFSSPSAEMDLLEGNTAQVEPANPAKFAIEPGIVVQPLDKWSEDRDKAEARPASSAYVNAAYGLGDLDADGKWTQAGALGMVWKPDVPEGWAPYKNGRWRYFEQLGYTWVSADAWGWMPYHNGRWARDGKLGWVWQPAPTKVFHPAEVYWLRGANFVGWGPLAPGEEWAAPNPGTVTPQAYTAGSTTYAAFAPDLRTIDGSGFPAPAAEQLKTAFFVPAPPSPAFLVSRLDALRPPLQAGSTRVVPSVPGVGFGDGPPPPSDVMTTPPPDQASAPPVSDAGGPPPPDGVYPVPAIIVPVEVPVVYPDAADHPTYSPRRPGAGGPGGTSSQTGNPPTAMRPATSGTTAPSRPTSVAPGAGGGRQAPPPPPPPNPGNHPAPPPVQSPPAPSTIQSHPAALPPSNPGSHTAPPAVQNRPVTPPPSNPGSRPAPPAIQSHPAAPPVAAPKNDANSKKAAASEQELYRMVLQDIDPKEPNLSNALAELRTWSSRFPKSSYANQRSYFLIHVYSRLDRPAEVLDTAAPLVDQGVRKMYSDEAEVLQILVAASAGVSKLPAPTAQQLATGHRAARELAEFLPQYFAAGRRPAGVRSADWSAARNQLEVVARQALEHRPAVRVAAAR